ncbi:MAG: hypothetical protein A2Y91_04995 [Chloroflexi bacterium RBG_13_54_8]|nr:MAG: hypothetical protein A2Y91_04995 [Chloroflexi bacterium RBG_13_54_8]
MKVTNLPANIYTGTIARRINMEFLKLPLYRNSIYLIINAVVMAGMTGGFWMLVARWKTSEDVGLGSALLSAAVLLAFISTLGFNLGLINTLAKAREGAFGSVNSSLTISGIAAVVTAVVFIVGIPLWSPALLFVWKNPVTMITFVCLVIVATYFNLISGVFVGLRKADFTIVQNIIFQLVKVGSVIVLAVFFSLFAIIGSWALGYALAIGVSLFFLLPRLMPGYWPKPGFQRQMTGELFRFSLKNFMAEGFWNSSAWLLPILVANLLGGEANGHFYIAWYMASLLFAVPLGVSLSLFAEGAHREERLAQNLKGSIKFTTALLVAALPVFLLAGDRILLLFGREYSQAATSLLRILTISAIPVSICLLYLGVARVQKKLRFVVLLFAGVAIGTMTLSYVLVPRMGIMGAGVSWLGMSGMAALIVLPRLIGLLRSEPHLRPELKQKNIEIVGADPK